ncbi:16S rRNA (cytosine(1402)-N(4))-methyltransferase RsmH [Candidatus Shapirobacteria bacterium]|nr:16S rRNA (cytosine(1402)-N(4))-methyltransferase RsmH [Candidatus Shapirobacteria bacterium]
MDYHLPVLLVETCDSLNIQSGKIYLDVTLGHGGHTLEILRRGGIVYGIDQDPENLAIVSSRINHEIPNFNQNFHPIHGNFANLTSLNLPTDIAGLLADLGLNSTQQKSTGRGFSFNDSESLDMRLDPQTQTETAENIINTYSYDELVNIFSKISQENLAEPIVRQIIFARQNKPIKTGMELANIIGNVYQQKNIRTSINPATKIFMALRIVVNQEFFNLNSLLNFSLTLPSQASIAIISFHSGEDRLVKLFTRQNSTQIIASKPITPTNKEIRDNPLSRSAVLRSYKII